jgi:rSAM/selenodomain-associated transferase 2
MSRATAEFTVALSRPKDAAAPVRGRISVVIPTLDEEKRIGRRLDELSALSGVAEILVVDGGSGDRTVEIARRHAAVRVLAAPRGRGPQMNAGARAAKGELLLFLHADVSLPPDAAEWIERALADRGVVAGAFRTWTIPEGAASWLGPFLHLADIRSHYTRLPYGDQAVFVRREAFFRAGGFPEQPLMEDIELSRRLRRLGRVVIVPAYVRVSGRRFLARPLAYTAAVNVFPLLYRLGVEAHVLSRFYGSVR